MVEILRTVDMNTCTSNMVEIFRTAEVETMVERSKLVECLVRTSRPYNIKCCICENIVIN